MALLKARQLLLSTILYLYFTNKLGRKFEDNDGLGTRVKVHFSILCVTTVAVCIKQVDVAIVFLT